MKWILRYLRGSSKLCLRFGSFAPVLEGFTDVDMAGDSDNRGTCSHLQGEAISLCHGSLNCKNVWRYLPPKPSILLLLKLRKRCFG